MKKNNPYKIQKKKRIKVYKMILKENKIIKKRIENNNKLVLNKKTLLSLNKKIKVNYQNKII